MRIKIDKASEVIANCVALARSLSNPNGVLSLAQRCPGGLGLRWETGASCSSSTPTGLWPRSRVRGAGRCRCFHKADATPLGLDRAPFFLPNVAPNRRGNVGLETQPRWGCRELAYAAYSAITSSDTLYFRLDEARIVESEKVEPGVILDFDDKENVVGFNF